MIVNGNGLFFKEIKTGIKAVQSEFDFYFNAYLHTFLRLFKIIIILKKNKN